MSELQKQIDYFTISAERDWDTANDLFKSNHLDACLFFCHLTLEKFFKGVYVKNIKTAPPFIHDLVKLALSAKINLSSDQIADLRTITTFNISSRYDNEKFAFYKQCTKIYTDKYLQITKELYLWLKKEYLPM